MANVLKFDEMEIIEYRKGSSKYGGLIVKIMEFLRIYKTTENSIKFDIDDFTRKSNINITDITEMLNDDDIKTLISFNIIIDNNNNTISFTDLLPQKMRFFESFL